VISKQNKIKNSEEQQNTVTRSKEREPTKPNQQNTLSWLVHPLPSFLFLCSSSESESMSAQGQPPQPQPQAQVIDETVLDDIIRRLTEVRLSRPGKQVQLSEAEIKQLCSASRDIFLQQPNLLELEAPIKICGIFLCLSFFWPPILIFLGFRMVFSVVLWFWVCLICCKFRDFCFRVFFRRF